MSTKPPSFKSRWQRAIGESDLQPTTRLILQSISIHFMDENGGHCFPSITDIMRVTGLSKPHVIRHLNLAYETGWLKRQQWGKGRGYRRWNYQAVIPEGGIVESRPDDMSEISENLRDQPTDDLVQNLNQHPDEMVTLGHHQPTDDLVTLGHQQTDDLVTLGHQQTDDLVTLGYQQTDDLVTLGYHKPCRDITMQRESNHSRARAHTCAAETAASGSETAPTLSVKEKNPMTKLTDALVERAKKTVRQRGIREDLSDTAISHSIAKCQAQKGYLEMTENAWIETVVQWVGKERCQNRSTTRSEPFSSQPMVEVSPEEKARNNAAYEARMAHHNEQHTERLKNYRVIGKNTSEVDQRQALQELTTKSAAPAPVQIPLPVMQNVAPRRPEGQAKELTDLLMAMSKAGFPANDIAAINSAVIAAGDQWRSVIVAGWNALGKCPQGKRSDPPSFWSDTVG